MTYIYRAKDLFKLFKTNKKKKLCHYFGSSKSELRSRRTIKNGKIFDHIKSATKSINFFEKKIKTIT